MRTAASLADLLAEEISEVEAFIELLRQEQKLLASSVNGDALMPLVERKSEFTTRLRMLSERREQFLAARNHETGRGGMDAYLAASTEGEDVRTQWRQLLTLAAEARALNETNGKLIGVHWQHNQKALAALMSATEGAMVYGPDGQQTGGGGRRLLGSA